jgi:hypothetical protein
MADTLADVKYKVAAANRVLWALGLASGVTASLGHATCASLSNRTASS